MKNLWDYVQRWERATAILVGLLLIGAGSMKTLAAMTFSITEYAWLDDQQFFNSVSLKTLTAWIPGLEILLGFVLISGAFRGISIFATTILFAIFCGINFFLVMNNETSCGCLGTISMDPRIMLAIDLGITFCLSSIVLSHWSETRTGMSVQQRRDWNTELSGLRAILLLSGISLAAGSVLSHIQKLASNDSGVIKTANEIYLKPENWTGKPFPLVSDLDTRFKDQLHNEMDIMLVDPACSKCQTELAQVVDRWETGIAPRTLVVYVDEPHGRPVPGGPLLNATLNQNFNWYVKTPTLIRIRENRIRNVQVLH